MRQAVDGGADYIAISGQTIDILGQALDAAKAKNIPVIDMYSTDDVGGAANGIYANVGGTAFSQAERRAPERLGHCRLRRSRPTCCS